MNQTGVEQKPSISGCGEHAAAVIVPTVAGIMTGPNANTFRLKVGDEPVEFDFRLAQANAQSHAA